MCMPSWLRRMTSSHLGMVDDRRVDDKSMLGLHQPRASQESPHTAPLTNPPKWPTLSMREPGMMPIAAVSTQASIKDRIERETCQPRAAKEVCIEIQEGHVRSE